MKSTLTGWQPSVGDLVWQQMYSPQHPAHDSTITERIEHGRTYCARRLMRLHGIRPDFRGQGVTRWFLMDPWRPVATGFPTGREGPSWVESDWCVLESVTLAEALAAERAQALAVAKPAPRLPGEVPLFELTEGDKP